MTSVRNTRVALVGALTVVCDPLCALRFVRSMVANGVTEPPTMWEACRLAEPPAAWGACLDA